MSTSITAIHGLINLLDALNCGALLVNRSGSIEYANDRLCQMIGRSRDQLIGRKTESLYSTEAAIDFLRSRLHNFDEAHEGEFFLPAADGSELPVIISGRPLGSAAPLADHRLITAIDISAQKKAELRSREEYETISTLSDTILEQAIDLKHYSQKLEEKVRERTAELHDANMEAIYMLAVASEAKDADTGAHVRRIEHYTRTLALEMGVPPARAEEFGYAAILHDVGKMQVPDHILKKPGPLDKTERTEMMLHCITGERILSKKPFFETARQIARSHHENWDGSGYPDGLRGEAIPLPARIVHLADVFDALTSARVYKPPWPPDKAVTAITEGGGTQFDPSVVSAFKALVDTNRFNPAPAP
ncbi:MAG TPA: HD domain-containing phosphohydrolase [Phycisphaerae bacterium]|nr:HD domain-containing phosphohydrolase [Phycisphaerae bacterium]